MKLLHETSRNLMNRPADEHFGSMREIMDDAEQSRVRSTSVDAEIDRSLFHVQDDRVLWDVDAIDRPLRLSHFAMSQLATMTGMAMRTAGGLVDKGRSDLMAQCLNVLLERNGDKRHIFYEDRGGDTYHLRSVNGTSYSRIYDAEVLRAINEWLLPSGMIPALPTMNTNANRDNIMGNNKPALFRGEQDSHCFFYSDKDPDDGLGGMRLGLMFTNSEVGTSSFKWSTFYFRDMCANFLIWGVQGVKQKRVIHRGNVRPRWNEFKRDIQTIYANAMARKGEDIARFERAAATAFAGDSSPTQNNRDSAAKRLNKSFGMSAKAAHAVVESALNPINGGDLSVWSIANGITWNAKETTRAGQMIDDSAIARKLLLTV